MKSGASGERIWTPIIIVFLAGSIATALVPLTVPILGPISREFGVEGARLGWVVSFPTLACAFGALALGVVVDRLGDVRILLAGIALAVLGDLGVSLAGSIDWLFAARLFQGVGYVCLSVAGPAFIQRTTNGDTRRAAMAFWAAHTPLGFAVAVFCGAQLVAAGLSWRFSFIGHAVTTLAVGVAVLALRNVRSASDIRRSAGTRDVLTSFKPYAVAIGAGATAMLQVSVMVMLPTLLSGRFHLTGPQSALVVVAAMTVNWLGAMLIVATRVRKVPAVALPISALLASGLGLAVIAQVAPSLEVALALVVLFAAAIGAANSLVWSLIPSAVPFPEASGATAGLITQGSFLGVLIGPPLFFWMLHESPLVIYAIVVALAAVMLVPLAALAPRHASDGSDRPAVAR